ncbi:MAG: hypothetical protein LBC57_00355 [Treponema sp.]|jgi:hypothetical protein|nr:hypothetical protein [Treponema sp.]
MQTRNRIFIFALFIFASGLLHAEDLGPLKINSIRQHGYGGQHVAYSDDFDAITTNPALYKDIKGQIAVLEFSISLIGDSLGMSELALALANSSENMNLDSIAEYASDSGGKIPLGFDLQGPLTSGYVGKGFGIGLLNRTYANMQLVGTSLNASANEDIWFNFGMAFNLFNYEDHDIDWGFNAKLAGRFGLLMKGTLLDMAEHMDTLVNTAPVTFSLGGGADLGFRYKWGDHFTAGLVVDDILSLYRINRYEFEEFSDEGFTASYTDVSGFWTVTPRLNLGAAYTMQPVRFIKLGFMADYNDVINLFTNTYSTRNPILNIGIGAEAVFYDFISLRLGVYDMLPHLGLGLDCKIFKLEAAYYGRELSNEPGGLSTYAFDLGILFRY